jgi:hypothetical protein
MKGTLIFAIAALGASSAWATFEDGRAPNGTPTYQLGSGSRAGGPANELNSSTGGVIFDQRSIAQRERIPVYQLGSGQKAGGPARELNVNRAPALSQPTIAETQQIPVYQLGSGQRTGGPARELNRAR